MSPSDIKSLNFREESVFEKFILSIYASIYCPFTAYMYLWIYTSWIKIDRKTPHLLRPSHRCAFILLNFPTRSLPPPSSNNSLINFTIFDFQGQHLKLLITLLPINIFLVKKLWTEASELERVSSFGFKTFTFPVFLY